MRDEGKVQCTCMLMAAGTHMHQSFQCGLSFHKSMQLGSAVSAGERTLACRNVTLQLDASNEEWQPIKLCLFVGHRSVEKELEQPITLTGQRLCCGCKRALAHAEPYDSGAVTRSTLSVFCSERCATRVSMIPGRRIHMPLHNPRAQATAMVLAVLVSCIRSLKGTDPSAGPDLELAPVANAHL